MDIISAIRLESKKGQINNKWLIAQLDKLQNELLNSNKVQFYNSTKILKPTSIEKYDIVYTSCSGSVPHPVLIFKKEKNVCFGIQISSTKGDHCFYKIEDSRYFKDSCAALTLIREKEESLLPKWIGVYDNRKEADLIIKLFRSIVGKI